MDYRVSNRPQLFTFYINISKFCFYSISRSGKTAIADEDEVETEPAPSLDDIKDIKLPKVEQDESKKSINYGYHPIIDFFGNFRFDTA